MYHEKVLVSVGAVSVFVAIELETSSLGVLEDGTGTGM